MDGKSWTILADATIRPQQTCTREGRTVVCESLCGEYRFVKLLWLNTGSNSSVKTISEIELFAEKETPNLDWAAIERVMERIDAIGEVTGSPESVEQVMAAVKAYDELTDLEKERVTNLDRLLAARNALEKLLVKQGDVDEDTLVTVSDVVELRKLIVAGNWTDRQLAAGDLDSNQTLSVNDVVALRRQIVEQG